MRHLSETELQSVSGADGYPTQPGRGWWQRYNDKGNNGFGNGGGDPAPGASGTNDSPNAAEKLADLVR